MFDRRTDQIANGEWAGSTIVVEPAAQRITHEGDRIDENEHDAVHRRLVEYARQRAALDAAEAYDLARAEHLRIHCVFGQPTMLAYLERHVGYAPHTARERLRVARALVQLPLTTAHLARGNLKYSTVKELTRVITPDTEQAWLAGALGRSVREVEELVAGHEHGDLPTDPKKPDLVWRALRIEAPTEGHALWREARKRASEERGSQIGDWDVLETVLRAYLQPGTGEAGPAHQIAYKQCPDCKRATQNGAGREIDVSAAVFERASCDARIIGSLDNATLERARTTVTPRMREQVFARDGAKCCVPGCRSSRNLDVHHIVFRSRGGKHTLSNTALLCSGHHALLHEGSMTITGRAPDHLEFHWTYGPPIPLDASPEEREALLLANVDDILKHVMPTTIEPVEPVERPTWDTRGLDGRRETAYRNRVNAMEMRQRAKRTRKRAATEDVTDDNPFEQASRRRQR